MTNPTPPPPPDPEAVLSDEISNEVLVFTFRDASSNLSALFGPQGLGEINRRMLKAVACLDAAADRIERLATRLAEATAIVEFLDQIEDNYSDAEAALHLGVAKLRARAFLARREEVG